MGTNLLDLQQASFDEGFTAGTGTSLVTPWPYPVALGGRGLLIDPKQYRRRTLPILRTANDQGSEPGEGSLSTEAPWRRFCRDWSLGAGQTFFDDTDSSRRRFRASKGVDCWTRNELSLLVDTQQRLVTTGATRALVVGAYLYVADGATLKYTADPSPATPTWTTVTTTGLTTITSMTTNGTSIFVCDGVKIMSGTAGGASLADLGTYAADVLGYANGRLLAANGNELVEVAAAGTTTVLQTHVNTGFAWAVVCPAPHGIFAAGNAGNISEVFFLGIDASTGGVAKPTHACALPEGETLNALQFYGGLFVFATSKGVRLGLATSDNGITFGPVVTAPGNVKCLEPEGNFVWFGWTNYDTASTGLGRADLAHTTDEAGIVPAYATDLMAAAQGTVTSVVTVGTKRYFTVSGYGLYGEHSAAQKVSSGYVTSGWVGYGLVEKKVAVSLDLRHAALPAGATVISQLTFDEDSGAVQVLPTSSTTGSSGPLSPYEAGALRFDKLDVKLTLTRATVVTTGPTVRHWLLRSYPAVSRIDEIILPIRVAAVVSDEDHDQAMDVLETWQYLKALEAAQVPVAYVEGASTYQVYVSAIEVQPHRWGGDRDFFEGLVFARLVTVEAT